MQIPAPLPQDVIQTAEILTAIEQCLVDSCKDDLIKLSTSEYRIYSVCGIGVMVTKSYISSYGKNYDLTDVDISEITSNLNKAIAFKNAVVFKYGISPTYPNTAADTSMRFNICGVALTINSSNVLINGGVFCSSIDVMNKFNEMINLIDSIASFKISMCNKYQVDAVSKPFGFSFNIDNILVSIDKDVISLNGENVKAKTYELVAMIDEMIGFKHKFSARYRTNSFMSECWYHGVNIRLRAVGGACIEIVDSYDTQTVEIKNPAIFDIIDLTVLREASKRCATTCTGAYSHYCGSNDFSVIHGLDNKFDEVFMRISDATQSIEMLAHNVSGSIAALSDIIKARTSA